MYSPSRCWPDLIADARFTLEILTKHSGPGEKEVIFFGLWFRYRATCETEPSIRSEVKRVNGWTRILSDQRVSLAHSLSLSFTSSLYGAEQNNCRESVSHKIPRFPAPKPKPQSQRKHEQEESLVWPNVLIYTSKTVYFFQWNCIFTCFK